MGAPTFVQVTFRIRNDDGSESAATWKEAQGDDGSINVDTKFRVRFLIDETAAKTWAVNNWNLYYNHNSGGYVAVGAATPIQFATSTYFTNGDDTLQRLTGGADQFLSDNNGMIDSTGGATNSSAVKGDWFDLEFCLLIDSAQVANNDTILLRVYLGTAALNGYTDEPTITVIEAAAIEAAIVEAATAADTPTGVVVRTASRTEDTTATESQNAAGSIYGMVIAEPATALDASNGLRTTASAITEAGSAADGIASSTAYNVDIIEATDAIEEQVGPTEKNAVITEAGNATDTLNSSGNIFGTAITEAVSSSDVQDGLRISASAITETVSAVDEQDGLRITDSSLTETVSAISVQNGEIEAGVFEAAIAEAATALDAQDALIIRIAAITESGTAITSQDALIVGVASRLEAATVSDALTVTQNTSVAIVEAASALDTQGAPGSDYNVTRVETATAVDVSDSEIAGGPLAAGITEACSALDTSDALRITADAIVEATSANTTQTGSPVYEATITEDVTALDTQASGRVQDAVLTESASLVDASDISIITSAVIVEAGTAIDITDAGGTGVEYDAAIVEQAWPWTEASYVFTDHVPLTVLIRDTQLDVAPRDIALDVGSRTIGVNNDD